MRTNVKNGAIIILITKTALQIPVRPFFFFQNVSNLIIGVKIDVKTKGKVLF